MEKYKSVKEMGDLVYLSMVLMIAFMLEQVFKLNRLYLKKVSFILIKMFIIASEKLPECLVDQLALGGRMV